jgi:spore coat assembly protein
MQMGQCVLIKDDVSKILYEIKSINNEVAYIEGVYHRICRNVSVGSLTIATIADIEEAKKKTDNYYYKLINQKFRQEKKYILGTILHIDGDDSYLNKCLELYSSLGIFAYGVKVQEKNMERDAIKILKQIIPSIIVLTGHDSYNTKGIADLENYTNTKNYMNAVKAIRHNDSNCCIIAGACQSNFEALMASGANYASSPKRMNIHTFDPAVIAIKVATTSFSKLVDFDETIKFIENGRDAFGGIETFGKMKLLV